VNRPRLKRIPRRGVYIIPTSLTVLNVFFGFTAILFSFRAMQSNVLGDPVEAARLFQRACWSLAFAAVFDTFDGLVARLMNATSEFGKEYDSLADVVTFGAAPAVLVYSWGLHQWGRLGGGIAFLFLVCGSLRLARFNIMTAKVDHRYFIGLPIPAAALTLAAIINFAPTPVQDRSFAAIMLVVTTLLALAMVSTIRYRSQKYANLQKERSFWYIVALAGILVVFYRWPEEFLFLTSTAYVTSGPVLKLWSIAFPSSSPAPPPEDAPSEEETLVESPINAP
jgi:CDP-diacylglycerol---serine O-phosphatidyltransferase